MPEAEYNANDVADMADRIVATAPDPESAVALLVWMCICIFEKCSDLSRDEIAEKMKQMALGLEEEVGKSH
jgi:hypothetical protein